MISFTEFVNKVESAKPPILMKYKKKARLSNLQWLGLFLLLLFSFLVPGLIYDCAPKKECEIISEDFWGGICAFLIVYIGGWTGFIYLFKRSLKEKRKEFTFRSSTHLLDTIVVIIGIIILCAIFSADMPQDNGKLSPIQYILIFLEIGIVSYFQNPKRKKTVVKSYQKIPLYRILDILGVKQSEEAPFYFSLQTTSGIVRFSYQDLTEKFGHYGENRYGFTTKIGGDIYEGIVFEIPDNYFDEHKLEKIKNSLQEFIQSFTGKDLFFHHSIKKVKNEKQIGHLYLYFITYHGNGVRIPNFYQDKYFHYTREDLDTIYKDVQTLVNVLDSRYS